MLQIVIVGAIFLHKGVLGEGYPKETPAGGTFMEGGSPAAGSPEATPVAPVDPIAAGQPSSPAPYRGGLLPALAQGLYSGVHSSLYPGLYPNLYAAGYPPLSTDYVSRYYGPTAIPVVLPDGHIADTAEVAAARAAHLSALQKAKALWYGAGAKDDGSYNPYKYGDYAYNYNYLRGGYYGSPGYLQGPPNRPYYGPLATPTVLPSGYLADTPATAAARAAHLSALARARADAALWRAKYYPGWN